MSITTNNQTEQVARIQAMRQRTAQLEREGSYWTENDKNTLKHLFHNNIGITEIALELQRTEVAVMQQIQALNLYEKVRRSSPKSQDGCLCHKCKNRGNCKHCNFVETSPQ
jgi:hypothetical protein